MNTRPDNIESSTPDADSSEPSGRSMKGCAPFFQTVQFMTVLPAPMSPRFDQDWIRAAGRYFPLVGSLIGATGAGVLLCAHKIWPGAIAAMLAVATTVIMTGALHEDGLADTADGLFGGRNRTQRLAIFKDSRLGTYGAVALCLTFGLRVAALASAPPMVGAAALIAAHGLARASLLVVMAFLPYGGDIATARTVYPERKFSAATMVLAGVMAVLAFAWLAAIAPAAAALGLTLAGSLAIAPPLAAWRLIGGYTGDILGATEQMVEVGVLLGAAGLL